MQTATSVLEKMPSVNRRKAIFRLVAWQLLTFATVCAAPAGDPAPLITTVEQTPTPVYAAERTAIGKGAELVTIFASAPDDSSRVPILCVLRDTLGDGDPENDKLRYVWLLNSANPGWWQRAAAALPFFYSLAASRNHDGAAPSPILDLADKHSRVLSDLGQASLQVSVFDPAGLAFRASTRAYLGNVDNKQKAEFAQAFSIVSGLEDSPETSHVFSGAELERLRARLFLGQRRFGGLASETRYPSVSENELRQAEEARGRNWDILRQAAESNGLWFEPLSLGSREPNYALLWIRRADLTDSPKRPFDKSLLQIADPAASSRLRSWRGYTDTGLDGDERVPVALYDLEASRAPLLLVDFGDALRPKRHEIFERGVTDVMKSVFDLSYLHDWYYYATRGGHSWVAERHGGAQDPAERLRGYAKLKLKLGVDTSLDPQLRNALEKQLAHLAMNPLESDVSGAVPRADDHYTRLLASSDRLAAKIDRDRLAEVSRSLHSRPTRILFRAGAIASAGLYRHHERLDGQEIALLDLQRRADYYARFLRQAAASSRIEVEFDIAQVRDALAFIAYRPIPHRAELLAAIYKKTRDESLRTTCLAALRGDRDPAAGRELVKLARRAPEWSGAGFSLLAH